MHQPTQEHDNGNMTVSVDVGTTGLDGFQHSIVEICIMPLLPDYTWNKTITPFTMFLQPVKGRPIEQAALRYNGLDEAKLLEHGVSQDAARSVLGQWFDKLSLGKRKMIPLSHHWAFDYGFLLRWLGHSLMHDYFTLDYRCTYGLAKMINDRYASVNEPIPFGSLSLKNLTKQYGIENMDPQRCFGNAMMQGELYKKLLGEMK